MARTLGIRLGAQSFELLLLEGSAKKPRITRHHAGEIDWDEDDPVGAATAALKEAAKGFKKKPDAVHVSIDAGLAAFRSLTVPFEENEKIESVLKFEVESQLPQWDIDQVVCDFHVLNSTGVESHLLVTAVQKDDVWGAITSAEKAGLEPHEAELEAVSVVNAAHAKGVFHADEASLLVYVGESSTSIGLIDGGQLRSMRAMHVGAMAAPVAAAESAPEGEESDEEHEEVAPTPAPQTVDQAVRMAQVAARVRRELTRALTAAQTANPIQAVYLVGAQLPGLEGAMLDEVPVERLDVFPDGSDLTQDERLRFSAAYGAALGAMGDPLMRSTLRREELRYTGRFERIELPLAVMSLMLFTVLLIGFFVLRKRVQFAESDMKSWIKFATAYSVGDAERVIERPYIVNADINAPTVFQFARSAETGDLSNDERGPFYVLSRYKTTIMDQISAKESDLGQSSDIEQPLSALQALTLVLGTLEDMGDEAGRFSIRRVNSRYVPGQRSRPDAVQVELEVTFFAADTDLATAHYSNFRRLVDEQPWCVEYEDRATIPLDPAKTEERGISIEGLKVTVNPRLAESVEEPS